jgi:hypothetical protein
MTHIKWPNELGAPVPYEPNWHNEAMRQNALLHSAMAGGAAASKRAEQLELERDALLRVVTDNHVALCRAEDAEVKLDKAVEALRLVTDACDEGQMASMGAGGMTIDAQIRRSVYNKVPAWPIEEARTLLAELEKSE